MKNKVLMSGLLLLVLSFSGCKNLALPFKNESNPENGTAVSEISWQELSGGFAFGDVNLKGKDFLVVKIDPKLFHFRVYQNADKEQAKTIREIHQEQHALLTFNGSFFGDDFKPIGFLESEGKVLHKVSPSQLLNGVFVIFADDTARMFETENFESSDNLIFALQNGPILLDEQGQSKILSDTGKLASRTALGIDKKGNIILIILKQSLLNNKNTLTLYQLAEVLKDSDVFHDMGLHSVLNLDGGPSTGMMIGERYYPEVEKVQNVVIVGK